MACDCCNDNVRGIVVCDGDGTCSVLTPPATGGPYIPVYDGGVWTFGLYEEPNPNPGGGLRAKPKKPTKPKKAKSD
jgi:hypothetical protein